MTPSCDCYSEPEPEPVAVNLDLAPLLPCLAAD